MSAQHQRGFSVVEVMIIVAVVAVLGLGAWFVFSKQKGQTGQKNGGQSSGAKVTWSFDGTSWQANGQPPECPSPLLASPVDMSLATAVLYPGQYRGGNYKTHGGLRFDNSKNNDITVRAPLDARLIRASRYIEQGEVQYLLMFEHPCGIIYRFDHLLALSPTFQAVANKLPEPKADDSRTTNISDVTVKQGEVIATAVGFAKSPNVSIDFGVNDLRHPNEISKNTDWAAKHPQKEFDAYGVCWIDLLTQANKTKVKNLPPGDPTSGAISDYCTTSAGTTLDS